MNKIIFLSIASLLTLLFLFTTQMALVFPLWMFVYHFRYKIFELFKGKEWKFILAGVIFGLIIEIFAIIQNLSKPIGSRALFHQYVVPDLIFGFFFYLVVSFVWFLILRKIKLSKNSVLVIAGIFGVIVEQNGLILSTFFISLQGLLIAIFVFFVHGIYPMLAYLVTFDNFSKKRIKPHFGYCLLAFIILFIISVALIWPITVVLRLLLG